MSEPTLTAQQSVEKVKKAIDIKKKPMGKNLESFIANHYY